MLPTRVIRLTWSYCMLYCTYRPRPSQTSSVIASNTWNIATQGTCNWQQQKLPGYHRHSPNMLLVTRCICGHRSQQIRVDANNPITPMRALHYTLGRHPRNTVFTVSSYRTPHFVWNNAHKWLLTWKTTPSNHALAFVVKVKVCGIAMIVFLLFAFFLCVGHI